MFGDSESEAVGSVIAVFRVRPWYSELGVAIGEFYESLEEPQEAEIWYRRVLSYAPLHRPATTALAGLSRRSGDVEAAQRLCGELVQRTGPLAACST